MEQSVFRNSEFICPAKGFWDLERDDEHNWFWAVDQIAELKIDNAGNDDVTVSLSFSLLNLQGYTNRHIAIYLDGLKLQDVTTPYRYNIYIDIPTKTAKSLKFITSEELMDPLNGDPRRFAFQLYDIVCEVEPVYKKSEQLIAVQKCECQLLKKAIEICEIHNINYFVIYGSLLGAVRHQGMIPWDDDIDIAMLRQDYDKFIEAAMKELQFPFFLQVPENDPECFYGGYAKLRDSSTTAIETVNEGKNCNQGVWIDILPIDKVYADYTRRLQQIKNVSHLQKELFYKVYDEKHPVIGKLSGEEKRDLYKESLLHSHKEICEKLYVEMTAAREEDSCFYSVLGRYIDYYKRQFYTIDELVEVQECKFEDFKVTIPKYFQHMIYLHAGRNYMSKPESEVMKPKHNVFWDMEKSYLWYQKTDNAEKRNVILQGLNDESAWYWEENNRKENIVYVVEENEEIWGRMWHDAIVISPQTYEKMPKENFVTIDCRQRKRRKRVMKVHQILVTLAYGDGVGNDVMAIHEILKKNGYIADIYAQNIDARVQCAELHGIGELPEFTDEDLIIYHLSIGTELNQRFPEWKGKKIIVYHNITPPKWFDGLDENGIQLCTNGLRQTRELAKYAQYCLAVSEFNKNDLISMGYSCPIDVLPIIIPFEDYKKKPNQEIVERYSDDYTNVIFTGRISPNKKQEDIIKAFAEYQKRYNKKSRLFLVGAYAEDSTYYKEVRRTVEVSGAENVIFSGHIRFDQILAYYTVADVFLCMSEHEGFCIPLLEAMSFELPVLAYASTAIPGTLGGSGILFEEKDYAKVAALINKVESDDEYRRKIIEGQNKRLEDFSYEKIESDFIRLVKKYTEEN